MASHGLGFDVEAEKIKGQVAQDVLAQGVSLVKAGGNIYGNYLNAKQAKDEAQASTASEYIQNRMSGAYKDAFTNDATFTDDSWYDNFSDYNKYIVEYENDTGVKLSEGAQQTLASRMAIWVQEGRGKWRNAVDTKNLDIVRNTTSSAMSIPISNLDEVDINSADNAVLGQYFEKNKSGIALLSDDGSGLLLTQKRREAQYSALSNIAVDKIISSGTFNEDGSFNESSIMTTENAVAEAINIAKNNIKTETLGYNPQYVDQVENFSLKGFYDNVGEEDLAVISALVNKRLKEKETSISNETISVANNFRNDIYTLLGEYKQAHNGRTPSFSFNDLTDDELNLNLIKQNAQMQMIQSARGDKRVAKAGVDMIENIFKEALTESTVADIFAISQTAPELIPDITELQDITLGMSEYERDAIRTRRARQSEHYKAQIEKDNRKKDEEIINNIQNLPLGSVEQVAMIDAYNYMKENGLEYSSLETLYTARAQVLGYQEFDQSMRLREYIANGATKEFCTKVLDDFRQNGMSESTANLLQKEISNISSESNKNRTSGYNDIVDSVTALIQSDKKKSKQWGDGKKLNRTLANLISDGYNNALVATNGNVEKATNLIMNDVRLVCDGELQNAVTAGLKDSRKDYIEDSQSAVAYAFNTQSILWGSDINEVVNGLRLTDSKKNKQEVYSGIRDVEKYKDRVAEIKYNTSYDKLNSTQKYIVDAGVQVYTYEALKGQELESFYIKAGLDVSAPKEVQFDANGIPRYISRTKDGKAYILATPLEAKVAITDYASSSGSIKDTYREEKGLLEDGWAVSFALADEKGQLNWSTVSDREWTSSYKVIYTARPKGKSEIDLRDEQDVANIQRQKSKDGVGQNDDIISEDVFNPTTLERYMKSLNTASSTIRVWLSQYYYRMGVGV